MHTNALVIFAKDHLADEINSSRTNVMGNQEANAVYGQLQQHTLNITQYLPANKFVYYEKRVDSNDLWTIAGYEKKILTGSDEYEKMMRVFRELFEEGYEKVVVIGIDNIELSTQKLDEAFNFLSDCDIVMGPLQLNGFYLLGMKQLHAFLFENIPLTKISLLHQRLYDIAQHSLTFHLLPVLNDVVDIKELFLIKHKQ